MLGNLGRPGCALSLCAALWATCAIAQQEESEEEKLKKKIAAIPSDQNKYEGDHFRLVASLTGINEFNATTDAQKNKCAPSGSVLEVIKDVDGVMIVRFYEIPKESDYPARQNSLSKTWGDFKEMLPDFTSNLSYEEMRAALAACKGTDRVNAYTLYTMQKAELRSYRRSGVAFGALVVPFKVRLGGDKAISSSSTVAPYIGIQTAWFQNYGLSYTHVVSAGLGLVPITDPSTGKTETKNAFSFATGMVLRSNKSDKFVSGLVLGKDFLSKADRTLDPNASKWWLSLYVGSAF